MKKEVERRVFLGADIELRAEGDDDAPILKGTASPFGKESEDMGFREVIRRGAFKKALRNSDTVALFNHDSNYVLGRKSSGTLRLHEGVDGLKAEIDPPQSGTLHDLVVGPVQRGDIKGMSIGFIVAEGGDEILRKKDGTILRTIHEVRELVDVSVVTFPAYTDTDVAVRSISQWEETNPVEPEESVDTSEDDSKDEPLPVLKRNHEARDREINIKLKMVEV